MLARFSTGTVRDVGAVKTCRLQPVCPIGPAIQVDQWKFEDIGGLREAAAARQQFRAAHGKELLCTQADGIESRPVAVAVAYRKVDLLAREVDVMQRRGNPQVDAWMRLGKMAEPMHQPFGGEIRRSADGEDAGVLTLQKPLGADGDTVQRVAHDVEIVAARFRDDEPLAFAIEELDGQLGFERFDLMAHRALRDAKLFGRARKALMPRCGLEGFQGIQWRQAWAHRTTS